METNNLAPVCNRARVLHSPLRSGSPLKSGVVQKLCSYTEFAMSFSKGREGSVGIGKRNGQFSPEAREPKQQHSIFIVQWFSNCFGTPFFTDFWIKESTPFTRLQYVAICHIQHSVAVRQKPHTPYFRCTIMSYVAILKRHTKVAEIEVHKLTLNAIFATFELET